MRVSVAMAGARGPQGPAGVGADVEKMAAGTINGGRVLRHASSTQVAHADALTAAHAYAIAGVSRTAALDGQAVQVATSGELEDSGWSWSPLQPIFCGPSGALTQTYSSAWAFAAQVGVALSATRIAISIQDPAIL